MSFIQTNEITGRAYAPGYFLANNEACTRETRQASASNGVSGVNGGKYIPMGVAYPSNDAYAIGITYEDCDVTTGDMPCSVVTKGTVYEDRLAVTGYDYDSVTLKDLVSPKEQGWYERSGSSPDYTYTASTDTTVNTSKTYYEKDGETYSEVSDYAAVLNPVEEGWYESDGASGYEPSDDTEGDKTKTYYERSEVRISAAAKSALEALGFKFVTSPAVSR